jgi:hypothetical protein
MVRFTRGLQTHLLGFGLLDLDLAASALLTGGEALDHEAFERTLVV